MRDTTMHQLSVFPQGVVEIMGKSSRPRKKPAKQGFVVLPSHDAILQGVYKFQLLTADQLRVLLGYSVNSLHRVQVLVKELTDNEYLLSFARPVVTGKAPLVYTLARKGLNYLAAGGFDVRAYFRPSKEAEKGYLFLQHTLALNDVLISAANLHKFVADYSLHSFQHERILKQSPFKVTVLRDVGGMLKEETVILIPDAYLEFRQKTGSGKEEKIPVLLELDRGTIERKNFQKKIRAYIQFIKTEGYKDAFGVSTVTVAFATTQGKTRLDQMMEWTRKELAATNEKGWLSDLFLFTTLPQSLEPKTLFLEPVWYQPFADDTPLSLLGE
jgi:Replication-relaxation